MAQFEPPPTYADVIIKDENTDRGTFNPLWLRWFLDLASFVKAPGSSGGSVNLLDDMTSILSNRSYGEYPIIPVQLSAATNNADTVLTNRTFLPPPVSWPLIPTDTQSILPNKAFSNHVSPVAQRADDTQNILAIKIFGS